MEREQWGLASIITIASLCLLYMFLSAFFSVSHFERSNTFFTEQSKLVGTRSEYKVWVFQYRTAGKVRLTWHFPDKKMNGN